MEREGESERQAGRQLRRQRSRQASPLHSRPALPLTRARALPPARRFLIPGNPHETVQLRFDRELIEVRGRGCCHFWVVW